MAVVGAEVIGEHHIAQSYGEELQLETLRTEDLKHTARDAVDALDRQVLLVLSQRSRVGGELKTLQAFELLECVLLALERLERNTR